MGYTALIHLFLVASLALLKDLILYLYILKKQVSREYKNKITKNENSYSRHGIRRIS